MIDVKIINKSDNPNPEYATLGSSGMDLRAYITHPTSITLTPFSRVLIPTGLYLQIPRYFEGQIRSRSGLSYKQGLVVLNGIGTLDSDYSGEVKVLLINLSDKPQTIHSGDRIAQLVFCPILESKLINSESLDKTDRGEGGFGSTGVK